MKTRFKKVLLVIAVILIGGFLLPERISIPVKGATAKDWHPKSFWFEPWGTSGVHKGIDIFAKLGQPVVSTTDGIVLYKGHLAKGGNVVLVLGPKWRLHYFAHLHTIDTAWFNIVTSGEPIGKVGDSGNAKGKPAHVHYSIVRIFPAPWAMDRSTQGVKKAFFIDPDKYLRKAE
ncbi:M23 family peptidase [Saccharophagus sp. K07]|jgi:murein DD-endopeptidase MepM/ murein hydrolase activator NlpD|uniref:M23 family metallopeptidase n=1 Tax=Saccharophagus sp. K07 TaxID=2283636 RepID=UPI001652AD57|nr:M23 family metallopeptidase [Saccharophagus sp. K07]MBC6904156.1 M23 family peptidase [Saccharophagus sp. K07]